MAHTRLGGPHRLRLARSRQAGLGNITGYTWEEVLEISPLPTADPLAYLDQVTSALAGHLRAMAPLQLRELLPGLGGRRNAYRCVRPILQGCFRHLGEIEALKSPRGRHPSG